jgi:hypothetical protein
MKIPLQTLGRVTSGDQRGTFLKVLADEDGDGLYVLSSSNERFEPCFDDWVESEAELISYFQGLAVEWLEP